MGQDAHLKEYCLYLCYLALSNKRKELKLTIWCYIFNLHGQSLFYKNIIWIRTNKRKVGLLPHSFWGGAKRPGEWGKKPRGCGAKRPCKNIVWAKRGKTPMWGKKPTMGQKAHGRFTPFCLFFGENNDVIPCDIFVTHFAKPVYHSLKLWDVSPLPCICVFYLNATLEGWEIKLFGQNLRL